MRPLTVDLRQEHLRPYFLWDEDVSIAELRERPAAAGSACRVLFTRAPVLPHRGVALAGFYLDHRTTDDLDLFTHEKEAFEVGGYALQAAADQLGGQVVVRQDAPGFRRYVVSRGDEAVVVDLVWERVPSAFPEKQEAHELRAFLADLVQRLRRAAAPRRP